MEALWTPAEVDVNLEQMGESYLSKWEAMSIYLRSINLPIWESLIQAEAQIVFQLGAEVKGYLWEREGQ